MKEKGVVCPSCKTVQQYTIMSGPKGLDLSIYICENCKLKMMAYDTSTLFCGKKPVFLGYYWEETIDKDEFMHIFDKFLDDRS